MRQHVFEYIEIDYTKREGIVPWAILALKYLNNNMSLNEVSTF
ncbi:hypothetical protein GARC_4083 [Paraglaciecola arctica BSs20135]|uniref:Uncharacterized protein n=1 Tax=Paraglaciecola arctica BSs20135 TaxID=493475 RepID=K6ZC65_9ALTE|nr:hypothetical protein GARC_4083 [Paraglaciecola arctica BSs20135]